MIPVRQKVYIDGVPTKVLQSELTRKVIGKDEEGNDIYGDFYKYYISDGRYKEGFRVDFDKENELDTTKAKKIADRTKKDVLNNLTVTNTSGKVFYADLESRQDLTEAINGAEFKLLDKTMWKLAEEFEGQRIVEVTLDEIREASARALQAKADLIGISET